MPVYVALLYSIVLPGGRLKMADLVALAVELGFAAPTTLLSTGNLLFGSRLRSIAGIEGRLETAFAERFGKHVDLIVRDAGHWRRTVAGNPFPDVPAERVGVRLQRDRLGDAAEAALAGALSAGDRIRIVDGDLWMAFAGSPAESRLLGALTPRRLGIGTSRGLGTMLRIDRALAEQS